MHALLASLLILAAPAPHVEALLVQVAPPALPGKAEAPRRERAVVLVPGLALHPVSKERPTRPELRSWQAPSSPLVRALARDADVFAFAYAQTVPVEEVARATGLAGRLRNLRQLGYREIVLLGHSAGGLVARHLVEDVPDLGITKVIQACPPNAGSSLAGLPAVRSSQAPFLASLSKVARQRVLAARADKLVPAAVGLAVVVGTSRLGGDGVVPLRSQWPDDLQRQGVPAYPVATTHKGAVRSAACIELLARLAREPLPRWGPAQVAQARRKLFAERGGPPR
jgi:hypothetical protein